MSTTENTEETVTEQGQETAQDDETTETGQEAAEGSESHTEEPETFPKEYVEKLRKENGDNRVKAKRADDLAKRLHTALVRESGRLADPSDLPFDEAHLEDPEALTAAIDDLLTRKAHLASRRPSGDIGQGVLSEDDDNVSLAGILRSNAR